jgi:hypothetical protein
MEKDFSTITEILTDIVANDKNFARNCKMSVIFSFWGEIVGAKFKDISKAYDYKNRKLYITCQSAFICQELTFNKTIILKKAQSLAKSLDLEIDEIIFNYKNWTTFQPNELENGSVAHLHEYTQEELDEVEIDESQLSRIKQNVQDMSFLNESQKEKYYKKVLNTLKAQKLIR